VADDINRDADRDEAIEALFFALYPRLARMAYGLVGDALEESGQVTQKGHTS
jgi:DNA-directed RNA polymerase specialized sigma24 family protein